MRGRKILGEALILEGVSLQRLDESSDEPDIKRVKRLEDWGDEWKVHLIE